MNVMLRSLCLIVGTSGCEKHTLISDSKQLLNKDKKYLFYGQEITNHTVTGSEDHLLLIFEKLAIGNLES